MFSKKKFQAIYIFLLIAWCIYNFIFLLKTGFIGDDQYNSQIRGQLIEENISLFKRIYNEWSGWLVGAGSIRIIYYYLIYPLYYLTQNPLIIKIIAITLIGINILLIYLIGKELTKSIFFAFILAALFPIFLQLRPWHDPILGFPSYMMPIITGFLLASLIYFYKYLREEKARYKNISVFFYFLALYMYEICIPFMILYIASAYKVNKNIWATIKKINGFIYLFAFHISTTVFFRLIYIPFFANRSSSYPAGEIQGNFNGFLNAFKYQLSSSFPLSFYFEDQKKSSLLLFETSKNLIIYKDDYIYLFLFSSIISYAIFKLGSGKSRITISNIFFIGSFFLFFPAILSALSGHQKDIINVGLPYIPVYLQYFGLCALIVSLIAFIAIRIKSKITLIIFSIVIGISSSVVAGINLGLNRTVAMASNVVGLYPSNLMYKSLKNNLFADLNNGSYLFRHMKYPSDYFRFYTTITGKIIHTCELSDINQKAIDGTDNYKDCLTTLIKNLPSNQIQTSENKILLNLKEEDTWTLSYNLDKKEGQEGRVILAKIDEIEQNKKTGEIVKMNVTKIKIYDLKTNTIKNVDLKKKPMDFMDLIKNNDNSKKNNMVNF